MGDGLPDGFQWLDNLGEKVVLARDREGNTVAVKKIHLEGEAGENHDEDLMREALSQWRVRQHNSIVSFRDLKRSDNHVCIVMDYAKGQNFEDYVGQKG